ncbi:RNA polymerase sigma factor [Sphingobacterium sp. SYP-B4668]|uniref:RNA polymerase sigma factor n=1 Tax=Sphingobacterium sp. SYP-B4668 TaxID=2996035 RepID=UPI0022DE19E0|nr:RNA polymerase sigma-70 factor [Sphingobacterium sp. SYP-B4668]
MNYTEFTDAVLISLVKQRDRQAFAEIYDRYAMLIYYRINLMIRDEDTTKDLVQDLFTSIWSKSDMIREDANLGGYLYIASKNRVLKLIQKGKTKSDYLNELGRYSLHINYDTVEGIDERELMLLITQEIAKLPPKMREVFQLSRIEDLSHKEIAEKLGISEGTVRKQVQYALRILKEKLAHHSAYSLLFVLLFRSY